MQLYYPEERLKKILNSKATFDNDEQEEACLRLVNELCDEDKEVAARTSYAYWYSSIIKDGRLSSTITENMAVKEAKRHFVGKGGNYEAAQASFQASLDFRKEWDIDVVRLCFVENVPYKNDEERDLCHQYRALIEEELPRQHLIMRGRDLEGRPIAIYMMRQEAELDMKGFILTRVFMAERGAAAVEYLFEGGPEESFTVFFRTGGYQQSNVPPMTAIRQMMAVLQGNYPERLNKLVILDPPFWMRSLYNLVSYFLDENTSRKVVMITGDEEKSQADVVAKEQAMPFVRPDGKLSMEIDVTYYLQEVPFYCLYDDCDPDKVQSELT